MRPRRVFYAAAGPADLQRAHEHWRAGEPDPTEVSLTFSGQLADFCVDLDAQGYFVSVHPGAGKVADDRFTVEHRPKRARRGARYHLEEIRYGLGLLRTALRWKADVAVLDSGATHYAVMQLFGLFGIPVVTVLHNSLWPAHFRSRGRRARLLERVNASFWRRGPVAVLGVSTECVRQVAELAPRRSYPVYEVFAQFYRERFADIGPPPPHEQRPFRVMFVGRVDRIKGVLDLPVMATAIEGRHPGLVHWEVCGRGPDLDVLNEQIAAAGLQQLIETRGWTSMEELQRAYRRSHAAIVPTRSDFLEGMAMTAVEAILAGRPLVTNPVVPALEPLAAAAAAGRTNDPDSHALMVERLALDPSFYEERRRACAEAAEPFYDRRRGLRNVLHVALDTGHGRPLPSPVLAANA